MRVRVRVVARHAWGHLVLLRDPLRHAPAVVDAVLCEALPARLGEVAGLGLGSGLGLGLGLGC